MNKRIEKGLYWDRAWKLVEGCTKVSPGCLNCWSERESSMRSQNPNPKISERFEGVLADGKWKGNIRMRYDNLGLPLSIKKPTRFSIWNDLFHGSVTLQFMSKVFNVIQQCPQHTFLILTKRPQRMGIFVSAWIGGYHHKDPLRGNLCREIMPNLWLGVTAENQKQANKRIPILLQIPAAVKFVSVEPMLGSVNLRKLNINIPSELPDLKYKEVDCLDEYFRHDTSFISPVNWVVCGEESGHRYRPLHPNWVRDLRDGCIESSTPFFLKQLWMLDKLIKMPRLDGQVWDQLPRANK